MIYRIYAYKDTVISNYQRNGVPQTASNQGAVETLSVFKKAAISGSTGTYATASLARALLQFDPSPVLVLTGSGFAPAGGITYHLVMKDCVHASTLPSSYDMEVLPITTAWDEGAGVDADYYSDRGFANWIKAKQNTYWNTPGGDVTGSSVVVHFDVGDEDLDADVTQFVNMWTSGTVVNNGLLVRVSSSLELSTEFNDYYKKKFFGRSTNYTDKRPYLEARWDDSIKDDRNNFYFDMTGSLYLYNFVRGQYANLSPVGTGPVYVRVTDFSGTILVATASFTGRTGVYSASFSLPYAQYSGSTFTDTWFSGTYTFGSGTFTPSQAFAQVNATPNSYFVTVTNIKNDYSRDEKFRFNLYIRNSDWQPAVVHTSSVDFRGLVVNKAYYSVVNDRTDEVVVPFGTGSPETTRLSYDKRGNFFDFYMSSLSPGNVYRLVFLFDVDGQRQLIDDNFKFRVM